MAQVVQFPGSGGSANSVPSDSAGRITSSFKSAFPTNKIDPPVHHGESTTVNDTVSRDELKAHLEAVEARTDTKMERILREIEASNSLIRMEIEKSNLSISSKIDVSSAKNIDKVSAATIALAMLALIYAMLAYGGDLFGLGISAKVIADEAAVGAVRSLSDSKPAIQSPQNIGQKENKVSKDDGK